MPDDDRAHAPNETGFGNLDEHRPTALGSGGRIRRECSGATRAGAATAACDRWVLDPPALERLMETIGDDRGSAYGAHRHVLERGARLVEAARRGLEQGQTDEVRRAAHTLKSNGASFGASSLSELSRQLETLARSGVLQGVDELIARIDAKYERVRIALETVREDRP
jgi:HPt (histidine-containing phosphotransfer) domain-containing protein